MRPSWDATWLQVAMIMGNRSQCARAQVGAVVVTSDNRVASQSYNGPPANLRLEGDCTNWCPRAMGMTDLSADYGSCSSIHAEANALIRANFTEIQGGTIYVSHASCINCAKQVANSGLVKLVHRVTDADLHRKPDEVEEYLRAAGLKVVRYPRDGA
jgi:dCMP deaminase